MWKPTMATRLLQSLLLILLAMSTVRGSAAAGGSPSWCVCRPDASHAALKSTIDYACGNGADCGPLLAGAKCHNPITLLAHCSYAANSYFHRISRVNEDATCDFGGAATLSEIDPSSEICTYPASTSDDGATASPPEASKAAAWCVCQPGVSDARLQRTLDYACGHGADCDALLRGGQCHLPDTLLAHCSYAANSYFQSNKDAACDFAGTAALSSTDPSSRTCKYPETNNVTSPPVGNLTLWILLMGLMMALVLFIILLCLACKCGSSTRARVSDGAAVEVETGAAVEVETGTAAAGQGTCSVCLEAWTNLGPHRICCIIACGHVYGRSCLESWLRQRGNSRARCPQCGRSFQLNDIINLYGPEALA